MKADSLTYRLASIDEIYALRFAILRPGHAPVRLYFPGDDAAPPHTWHFGAFSDFPTPQNIACLTLLASTWEGLPAIQLRGMAVAADWRGIGVGKRLLTAACRTVAEDERISSWKWWCNARMEAVAFYEHNGWRCVSDEFMIEGVGPHRKMLRRGGEGGGESE